MDYGIVTHFMQQQAFSPQAQQQIEQFCCKAAQHRPINAAFIHWVQQLQQGADAYEEANAALQAVCEAEGLCEYTAWLVLYILLTPWLQQAYTQRGISHRVYCETVKDFWARAQFCYSLHGVWGTIKPHWFRGYFMLQRFTLGRLQFEVMELPYPVVLRAVQYQAGHRALAVHIPGGGKLDPEECQTSFIQAKTFFGNEPVLFWCDSWLLYPQHRQFLPTHSNILKFMDFFTLVDVRSDDSRSELWRIFGKDAMLTPAQLPRNTSLQAAYAEWLAKGGSVGGATGVFLLT